MTTNRIPESCYGAKETLYMSTNKFEYPLGVLPPQYRFPEARAKPETLPPVI